MRPEYAFPIHENSIANGITVRDYFAAAALQGLLAEDPNVGATGNELADWAFALADAMIERRKK